MTDAQIAQGMTDIATTIVDQRGVLLASVLGRSRKPRIVNVRAEIMTKMRLDGYSVKAIGEWFSRDHTSVYYLTGSTKNAYDCPEWPAPWIMRASEQCSNSVPVDDRKQAVKEWLDLREGGMTAVEAALFVGYKPDRLRKWLRKLDLTPKHEHPNGWDFVEAYCASQRELHREPDHSFPTRSITWTKSHKYSTL